MFQNKLKRGWRLLRFAGGLLVCSFGQARAVVIHDFSDLASAAALASAYDGVGWVEIEEGSSSFRGTGVLIDEEWVLTAAHNWLADEVTALNFHINGASYSARPRAWYQHPGWQASPGVGPVQGWDVGLFRLSSAVSGVTPVSIYRGNSELGAGVTVLGAGSAGTASTGPRLNTAPIIYGVTNTIDRVISTSGPAGPGGLLAFDFDNGSAGRNSLSGSTVYNTVGEPVNILGEASVTLLSSSALATALEGTSAAGDSGGPAFADFGDGPEVIGLVSWGVNPTEPSNLYGSDYGDVTYLTRVSALTGWIDATIPEPGIGSLLLCALSLRIWKRRARCLDSG